MLESPLRGPSIKIDNQNPHHVARYGMHQALDQLIKNGTLVPRAGTQADPLRLKEREALLSEWPRSLILSSPSYWP
jgi:hypothetical protein